MLIDLGRFKLTKNDFICKDVTPKDESKCSDVSNYDEDELYMTPCSTPPGSEISCSESPTLCNKAPSSQNLFHNKLGFENEFFDRVYESYIINLKDIQILVCKKRQNDAIKTASNCYILEKFNILLKLQRRLIYTNDPDYPFLTLHGSLPRMVGHVNEKNIKSFLKIMHPIFLRYTTKLKKNSSIATKTDQHNMAIIDDTTLSNIIKTEFEIEQIILELESSEKSFAEVQVIGARASLLIKPEETHINMTIHGFLLVDASQSFGADFELLIASHRHYGYVGFLLLLYFLYILFCL